MSIDFSELNQLAQQSFPHESSEVLASQALHYENASLAEIFDLLESAVETYTALSPSFSPKLRENAEQEIEFFYHLIQKQISGLLQQPSPASESAYPIAA